MRTTAWSIALAAGALAAPSGSDNWNTTGGYGGGYGGGWGDSSSSSVASSLSASSIVSTETVSTSSEVTSSSLASPVTGSSSSSSVSTLSESTPISSSSPSSVTSTSSVFSDTWSKETSSTAFSDTWSKKVSSSTSSASSLTLISSLTTSKSSSSSAVSSLTSAKSSSTSAVSSLTSAKSSSSSAVSSLISAKSSSTSAVSSLTSAKSSSTSPVSSLTSSTPVGPVSFSSGVSSKKTISSAAVSSGSKPVTSGAWSSHQHTHHTHYTTYVTKITTLYTTVCPVTKTHVTGGSTIPSTYVTGGTTTTTAVTTGETTLTTTFITTSTLTSVLTSTIITSVDTATGGVPTPSSSASSPESETKTTVTKLTTIYTTVCPVTLTEVAGTNTKTTTLHSTSTVTSEYESTITLTVAASQTGPTGGSTPTGNGPETTVTDVTTVYTTVCPVTQTAVNGESTLTRTIQTTSTVTTVYQSTITVFPSGGAGGASWTDTWSEVPWSTVPWGTTVLSYPVTLPFSYPTTTPTTPIVGPTGGSGPGNGSGSISRGPSGSISRGVSSSMSRGSSGSVSRGPSGSISGVPSSSIQRSGSAQPSGSVTKKSTISAVSSSKASGSVIKPTTTKTTSSKAPEPTKCVPCEGQPGSDPEKWCGYTIHDNSYLVTPKTCKTVEYDLYLTNTTIAPDGVARQALVFNGQLPGPKIVANWGDTIVVHVHNQLTDNGTSIHFHGTRQNYTNDQDGVPSITQCPVAPGESQTYTFIASNYGSSWYHSHYSLQLYDGAYGPMVVHGPAAAEYDEEEFISITDWNHVGVNVLYDGSQTVGNAPQNGPQTLDTGLINGKNVFNLTGSPIGERFTLNVVSGKTYRLRLVNTAIQTTFKFYLDAHTFQVIANDYVPITPYTTNVLNINTGQRYDVIFKADQPVGNYWLRADGQQTCTTLKNAKDIKAIVSYAGAPAGLPTSSPYTYTEECVDEPLASLVPIVPLAAGASSETISESIFIGGNGGTPNLYKWTLSGTTFQSQYGDPTLVSIVNNGSVPDYSGNLAIEVPDLGEWVYVIIESIIPVPHPIHLHGHDFQVLAQGYGSYSSSTPLNLATPARRDTVLMPGDKGRGGFVVVAFQTDNPGAWLMHCHIGWHAAMGFALQIIENLDGIKDTVSSTDALNDVCSAWSDYAISTDFIVADAGI